MRVVAAVARKELRDAVSSSWLLMYAALFTALALGLSYPRRAQPGQRRIRELQPHDGQPAQPLPAARPLAALSLGAGAIAGERDRGALTYLLAQPLDRWELLLGKFAGLSASIAIATLAGFGAAGIVIAFYASTLDAGTYLMLVGLVLALVCVMTGLGLVASVISATRVQALGLSPADLVRRRLRLRPAAHRHGVVHVARRRRAHAGVDAQPRRDRACAGDHPSEPDLQILGPFGSYLMERVGTGGATAILSVALAAWIVVPVSLAAWLFEIREA